MLVNVWGRLGRLMKLCKGGTLGTFSKFFKNMQRGDPWKKKFLIFFLTLYSTLEDHMRLLECHLRVLECWIPHNQPNVTHSPLWNILSRFNLGPMRINRVRRKWAKLCKTCSNCAEEIFSIFFMFFVLYNFSLTNCRFIHYQCQY